MGMVMASQGTRGFLEHGACNMAMRTAGHSHCRRFPECKWLHIVYVVPVVTGHSG